MSSFHYLLQQVQYNMFQDYCIHDGTENPLCATTADDDWWASLDLIKKRRNNKYEGLLCGVTVVKEKIHYNMDVNVTKFMETFDV